MKLIFKVQSIVQKATEMKNKDLPEYQNIPVNYACIFSKDQTEYNELIESTKKIGKVVKEFSSGPLFQIDRIETVSGPLKLFKIRLPVDPPRSEIGDADFTIPNFVEFERKYLSKPNFKRIQKPDFYMIELIDQEFDVKVYFSNPPLTEQLGIK